MNERTEIREVLMSSSTRRPRGGVLTLVLVAGIAVSLAAGGCGKDKVHHDNGVTPPRDPNPGALDHANAGWEHFVAQRYAQALSEFDQALQVEPEYLFAWEGRAWSELRLSNTAGGAAMDSIAAAYASFDSALAHFDNWQDAASEADAYVGKSIAASALSDWSGAATAAARAVEVGGEAYVFRGDHSITIEEPRLVAAESYLRLQEYDQAYAMLVALDVTVLLRIDPHSEEFVELMLEELQRLSNGS